MNHESWQRVKDLFEQAMDRTEGERAAFLDDACAGDAALRGEVDRLLRGDADAGEFLASGAPSFGSAAILGPPFVDDIEAGDRIGDYQLIEQIGTGGFGVVFRAQQASPLRREVAVKVIKLGMDTRKVVARFAAERQALAMMEHPHIARVYDAGATDGGRPYFVMELVRGAPITTYCDDHALTLRARLGLFADVCRAVQHAHQKGVIHRDIKPSNVMVTGQNGDAAPKVIDFGIAKAIDHRLIEETMTDERHPIGTPEYMSPEQASPGVDIDTRSDVYSLGVLLYQLLTGTTPFDSQRLRRSPGNEIQRILREEEPPKPSTRLLGLPRSRVRREVASDAPTVPHATSSLGLPRGETNLDDVARQRGVDVHRLQRFVRGELDWIVMKSLEKDRSRRYATANDLAADVGRFLNHEPVVASPPSTAYRVRKFVRRHRGFVASAAAIFAIVIAAGVTSTVFGVNADRQRGIAERERGVAKREATLRAAADEFFLERMFGSIDVEAAGDESVTVRQVLDLTVERADEIDDQAVEALIRSNAGSIYWSLAVYKPALEQLTAARRLHADVLGEDTLEAAQTMYRLGRLLLELGKYDRASDELERAISVQSSILGADHLSNARAIDLRSQVLLRKGEIDAAAEKNLQALEMYERLPTGTSTPDVAECLVGRATYLEADESDEALRMTARAVAMMQEALGREHSRVATLMLHQGRMLATVGRFDEAEPIISDAYAIRKQILPPKHPSVTQSATDLGALYVRSERFEEVEALLREAIASYADAHDADHEDIADTRVLFAQAIIRQEDVDRFPEAVPQLEAALLVYRRALGDQHWKTVNTRIALAYAVGRIDAPGTRERVEREMLEAEVAPSDDARNQLVALKASERLARLHALWGRDEEAFERIEGVVEAYRDWMGDERPETLRARLLRATLLGRLGHREDAEAELLDVHRIVSGLDHLTLLKRTTAEAIVTLYGDWGRTEAVEDWSGRL